MNEVRVSHIFKVIWMVLALLTVYTIAWLTFLDYILDDLFKGKYSRQYLLISNLITLWLLLIYTKEILYGYNPKSNKINKISLSIYLLVIVFLILIQYSQFKNLYDYSEVNNYLIVFSLITILTSYYGIIINRLRNLSAEIQ